MFRLTTTNSTAKVIRSLSPLLTIWDGNSRSIAPLIRVNCYANNVYQQNWETGDTSLDIPVYVGAYGVMAVNSFSDAIAQPYNKTSNSIDAGLNSYWLWGSSVNFYLSEQPPAELVCVLTYSSPSGTIQFTLPNNFTANTVTSLGLTFVPESSNTPGTFTQTGNILTVYTSASYFLDVGQTVSISGNLPLDIEIVCAIASFHFPQIQYIDSFDWVGKSFRKSIDPLNPQIYEFTWDSSRQMANVFLDPRLIPFFNHPKINILHFPGILTF